MPIYNRRNNERSRTEIQVKDFMGLRSSPANMTPPNALNIADNYYFSQRGVLDTRPDLVYKYTEIQTGFVKNAVEFTTTAGTSYLCYPRNNRLVYYDGANYAYATYDLDGAGPNPATPDFLNSLSTVRDICAAFNAVYIVDGSNKIWKFDGSTVTVQTTPNSGTYGNPVTICYFANRLFVITDAGYMRYTEPGVDNIWEERVLLPGTVSISGATVTGINTIFTDSQLEPGVQLLFVNGSGATEYAKIANVTSNTSLTLSQNIAGTFGAGSLVYFIGNTFFEPLEILDGLLTQKMIPFGNFIAISKSSKDSDSPNSKLIIADFQAQQDSSALLTRFRRVSTGYNLHPFSLCEWEDSLLFWTDRGLYVVTTPPSDANNIKPQYLTELKLEDYTSDLALQKRSLTRIGRIPTDRKNLIYITFAVKDNADYADTMLVGYEIEPFVFEFTEFSFFTEILDDDQLESPCKVCYLINYKGAMQLITNYGVIEAFSRELGYDTIPILISDVLLNSEIVFLNNEDIFLDNNGEPLSDLTVTPIKKQLRFGALSNDLFNNLTISKMWLSVEEKAAAPTLPVNFYNIRHRLDDNVDGFEYQRVYADGVQITNSITCDNITITVDSDVITIDSDIPSFQDAIRLEYFCNARAVNSINVELEDFYSTGRLKIWGYGMIIKPTRWAS